MPWRPHEILMGLVAACLVGWLGYALARPTPSLQSGPATVVNITEHPPAAGP